MNFKNVLFSFVFLLSAVGCATDANYVRKDSYLTHAERAIKNGDWAVAYRFLEDGFKSPNPDIRATSKSLYEKYTKIKTAAISTFDVETMKVTFSRHGAVAGYDIEEKRIELYAEVAADNEVVAARNNLKIVSAPYASEIKARNARNDLLKEVAERRASGKTKPSEFYGDGESVHEHILLLIGQDDREEIKNKYPLLKVVEDGQVARVLSAQLVNRSTSGSNAGSNLGSLFGQSTYIDNSRWNNYSATSQIAAGVLGALVGSVFDVAPQSYFIVNYGVANFKGEVVNVTHHSSEEFMAPSGMCVWLNSFTAAPAHLCKDSVSGFLRRMGILGSDSVEISSERVKCRISESKVMEIPSSDCIALGGVRLD